MKNRSEQPRKSGSFLSGANVPGHQNDWWKHAHPGTKIPNGPVKGAVVKTGAWKNYSAKNPGNK